MALVFIFVALLSSVGGDTIHGSYKGNVSLSCNHNHTDPAYVRWRYKDRYSGHEHSIIEQAGDEADADYGRNFTAERILEWEYTTGNIKISSLGCWEDQVYICELFSGPVASHNVILGKPLNEPTITVYDGDRSIECQPGRCEGVNKTTNTSSVDVTLRSSVLSKPRVLFFLNGREVQANSCSDGDCPGEMMCVMYLRLTFHVNEDKPEVLDVLIAYEGLPPWTFNIPVAITSTWRATTPASTIGTTHVAATVDPSRHSSGGRMMAAADLGVILLLMTTVFMELDVWDYQTFVPCML